MDDETWHAALAQAEVDGARGAMEAAARSAAHEHLLVLVLREIERLEPGALEKMPMPRAPTGRPDREDFYEEVRRNVRRLLGWATVPKPT